MQAADSTGTPAGTRRYGGAVDWDGIIADLTTDRPWWDHRDEFATITSARIETTAGACHVWASVGGEDRVVFSYFPDELTFDADEFVGRTVGEARQLHYERDLAWLQS